MVGVHGISRGGRGERRRPRIWTVLCSVQHPEIRLHRGIGDQGNSQPGLDCSETRGGPTAVVCRPKELGFPMSPPNNTQSCRHFLFPSQFAMVSFHFTVRADETERFRPETQHLEWPGSLSFDSPPYCSLPYK